MHIPQTIIVAAFAAGTAPLALAAPAAAVPSGPQNASQIVTQLKEAGNTVIVNRNGNLPLSECAVTGVRVGQTYSRYDSGYPGAQMDPMRQAVGMTVYVDAQC